MNDVDSYSLARFSTERKLVVLMGGDEREAGKPTRVAKQGGGMSLTIGIARKLSSGDRQGRLGLELQRISVLATLASGAARPLGPSSGPARPVPLAASGLFAHALGPAMGRPGALYSGASRVGRRNFTFLGTTGTKKKKVCRPLHSLRLIVISSIGELASWRGQRGRRGTFKYHYGVLPSCNFEVTTG